MKSDVVCARRASRNRGVDWFMEVPRGVDWFMEVPRGVDWFMEVEMVCSRKCVSCLPRIYSNSSTYFLS